VLSRILLAILFVPVAASCLGDLAAAEAGARGHHYVYRAGAEHRKYVAARVVTGRGCQIAPKACAGGDSLGGAYQPDLVMAGVRCA
jgi:hypothetical protein